jgi:hypothetical protein
MLRMKEVRPQLNEFIYVYLNKMFRLQLKFFDNLKVHKSQTYDFLFC